jgi:pheromone a factor receptor
MSILVIAVLLPYNFWILWVHGTNVTEEYSWSRVHGGNWNQVIKLPSNGEVRLDRWGQVTAGYLAFILFGTGADANNTYKRMLCAIGLGKIFPSLYKESRSGTSTPSNVTFAKVWSSTASKARSIFSKRDSVVEGSLAGTRHNSVSVGAALSSSLHSESTACHNTSTATPIPSHQPPKPHFINRLFARRDHLPMLPLFANTIVTEMADLDKSVANKSPTSTTSSGGYSHHAHAWSSDIPTTFGNRNSDRDVRVVQEVHQVVHHGKTDKVDRPGTSA